MSPKLDEAKAKLPFTRLGAYDVLAPIAEGGMATVYLGEPHGGGGPRVALKVIRAEHARNKDFIAMFLDEAKIASRLVHPGIVRIIELGVDDGRHFLAMELLEGHTLLAAWAAAQQARMRFPHAVVAWIGARIADALHYAHELRDEAGEPLHVVHRDVNPSNVFLTADGHPKVIDFGLAKAANRLTVTGAGIVKGKLAYLSPEQTHGNPADRRADVFALGVTLWELSVDRRLFREDSDVETVRRVLAADVPDPRALVEGYPDALAVVVLRALARDPDARYATAEDLARALDACVARESGGRGVTPETLAALLRTLFPPRRTAPPAPPAKPGASIRPPLPRPPVPSAPRAPSVAPPPASGPGPIQAWDDQAQKMTWMQPASAEDAPHVATTPEAEREARIRGRVALLAASGEDRAALGRAHLELAILAAVLGETAAGGAKAAAHAADALSADPGLTAAHGVRRRALHARGAARALLDDIDAEIAGAATDDERASGLAERARLLAAAGEAAPVVRAAWERVKEIRPRDPASLDALDASYSAAQLADQGDASVGARRAEHLGHMADAYADEPALAAWLHVERAEALDQAGDVEGAAAALVRASTLDPRLGPVRDACVRHAERHRDAPRLIALLTDEAARETDPARAARLDLEAASIAIHPLGDRARAIVLLERAAARAPTTASVDRRVMDELVRLHEEAENWAEARAARHARLPMLADARDRSYELRRTAAIAERAGDVAGAAADVALARAVDPAETSLLEEEDRLLALTGAHERRAAIWRDAAAAAERPLDRADRRVRAARIAEALGKLGDAENDLRAALVASPAHAEAVDRLTRLLSPPQAAAGEDVRRARARIEIYTHAAEHAIDPARRIAYLEASALLWEEILGEPALAAAAYEAVLTLDPARRGAVIGLARNAARNGDAPRLSSALLAEARATSDVRERAELIVRAARAIAEIDPERARASVEEVLATEPSHAGARAAEIEIHARAGRWQQVDRAMAARIEHTSGAAGAAGAAGAPGDPRARAEQWIARAEIQRDRLRSRADARASLEQARALDPTHPALEDAILALGGAAGDPASVAAAHRALAKSAATVDARARHLMAAGAIDEHVRLDDAGAAEAYRAALQALPDDAWASESLARVLGRAARMASDAADVSSPAVAAFEAHLASRAAGGDTRSAFELARRQAPRRGEADRALPVVESVLSHDRGAASGLRTLLTIARTTGSVPMVANALAQQEGAFTLPLPRLAAMWGEAALVEWELPEAEDADVYHRILSLAPGDRAALDALLRCALRKTARGDGGGKARADAVRALEALLAVTTDPAMRFAQHLSVALLLDDPDGAAEAGVRAALANYRAALQIDPGSVTAALGATRLAAVVGDAEAGVAAARASAELAPTPRERAYFLVQAAGVLLATKDARLGNADERRARAGELAERALAADAESMAAAAILATVRAADGHRDRHLEALRSALSRARGESAVIQLGSEVARVALLEPRAVTTAIDALQRVREVAPTHAPSLRALGDLHASQEAWPEAAEALEAVVANATERGMRRAAQFDLADVYARHLARPADVERALRGVLDQDPGDPRALRALVDLLRAPAYAGPDTARAELPALLGRLLDAEPTADAKRDVALQLFEARAAEGDRAAAERALVEAAANAPAGALLGRIAAFHAQSPGGPADHARTLAALVARTQQLGRPDAAALATLGQIEVDVLGRFDAGAAHLRSALGVAPGLHEARAALARAEERAGAHADATSTSLSLIDPDAAPLLSLRDPGAALAVLEQSLEGERRLEEATVARELRAIGGALDDAAHFGLRARRLPHTTGPSDPAIDAATLHGTVLPREGQSVLLEVAAALAGIEPKLLRIDLADVGVSPRDRIPAGSGHPLRAPFERLLRIVGLPEAELVVTDQIGYARVLALSVPWVVVPRAIATQPEPVQLAALGRALGRAALRAPWLADLPTSHARALLVAAARVAVPTYGASPRDSALETDVQEFERRLARAIGRKQKKALVDLAGRLEASRAPSLPEVDALVRALVRAEVRVAFLVTGDLLATFDELRALDGDLARATAVLGPAALAAILAHPLAGDVARFALTPRATAIRRAAGTIWTSAR